MSPTSFLHVHRWRQNAGSYSDTPNHNCRTGTCLVEDIQIPTRHSELISSETCNHPTAQWYSPGKGGNKEERKTPSQVQAFPLQFFHTARDLKLETVTALERGYDGGCLTTESVVAANQLTMCHWVWWWEIKSGANWHRFVGERSLVLLKGLSNTLKRYQAPSVWSMNLITLVDAWEFILRKSKVKVTRRHLVL